VTRLPVVSGRDFVRAMAKLGFILDRQKGSHLILFRADPPTTLSVPDHRELDRGTLRGLLRQAGISPAEFSGLL